MGSPATIGCEMADSRIIKGLLVLLSIWGLIPVSNPMNRVSVLKFRVFSIITALSIFHMLYPAVLYADVFYRLVNIPLSQLFTLSHRFIIYSILPAYITCNTIVRLASLCYCSKTVGIVVALWDGLSPGMIFEHTNVRRKTKWTNRIFLFSGAVRILADLVTAVIVFLNKSDNQFQLQLLSLPENILIQRAAHAFAHLCNETAVNFALGFVVIVGVALLEVQDELFDLLYESCVQQTQDNTRLSVVAKEERNNLFVQFGGTGTYRGLRQIDQASEAKKAEIFKRFVRVKNLFRDYEVIAGWYAWAVVMSATTGVVRAFTYTVLEGGTFFQSFSEAVDEIWTILLLSFFGEHMRSEVSLKTS